MSSIYGLKDPRDCELRYVGKTKDDARKRLISHVRMARAGRSWHVSCWLRALLAEGLEPELVVLERDPVGGLDAAERAWIRYARDMGCRLTNLTEGGDGGGPGRSPGVKDSLETRRRKSEARRRWKHSPETVEKMRQIHLGAKRSDETRARISAACKGRVPWNKGLKHTA